MGKSRRLRRQLRGTNYALYPAETTLGWRVIRRVSGAQGEEMVARGKWREVYDEHYNHIGYQMIPSCTSDSEILHRTSSNSISVRECELNAGLYGKSHTAEMPEEKRICRHDRYMKPLPPEDAIERAQEKVREFGRTRIRANPKIILETL